MTREGTWLDIRLEKAGLERRDFLKFCSAAAAYMALPQRAAAEMATAIELGKKPTLVWLEFQDCCGNTESLLRATRPGIAEIVLDTLSIEYQETIMAAAGHQAEDHLKSTIEKQKGQYIAVIEGSIPTGANGAYCTIGGRSAMQIAQEVTANAAATIAVGTCAAFGGLPAAAPNPTGALGVADALPKVKNLINLPACPVNVENLTAVVVYYLTYKRWPELDSHHRPLFAYGKAIHDNCERRAHFDAGQYVEQWGDEGHRTGYCLFKVGCKGPVTYQNCPVVRWNDGVNWPIGCGHPCLGCAEADFWDKMTPFYRHLTGIAGYGVSASLDTAGVVAVAGVGAAFAGHGLVSLARRKIVPPENHEETPYTVPATSDLDPKGGKQ